jgi:phage gpG-like protein
VTGLTRLKGKMARRKKNLDNRSRFYQRAVVYVDAWIQKNFKTQGEPFGGWQPLSPVTIARRRKGPKARLGEKILQDTGQLKSRWKKTWGARQGIIQAGVPYAVYHDEGLGAPKREILPEKEMVNPAIKKILGIFIKEALK